MLELVLFIVVVTVIFFPWIVGFVDCAGLFFVGRTVSWMEWTELRVLVAMLYPVVMAMILGIIFTGL